ncbi:MAG TPA: MerR family transcriptional regulator, partial [Bacteroidia bacterium]
MEETEKLYYSIGEVAEMFDVKTSLIRFWEKEFDIIKPQKNTKGNRLFTKKDIENFRVIHHLVKDKGFTLQGAKEHLKGSKVSKEVINKNAETVNKLKKLKEALLELKK